MPHADQSQTRNPKPETLADWLSYLERLHPATIELGLDRVNRVKQTLGLEPTFPLIIVGGTNGKGSTCALLEAMLLAGGYRVACYTSPHILHYNERVRLNGRAVSDVELCHSFSAVEAARGETSLTYFEFGTLAAMWLFIDAGVDVAVLEVGLGGRLDAVNVFDVDCAIVTSVALDHMDYLGNTREAIGYEKAGIFRAGRPAIYGEADIPHSVLAHAAAIGADLQLPGRDFGFQKQQGQWQYQGRQGEHHALPYPALRGEFQMHNASAALAALDTLRERLPLAEQDIRRGLLEANLAGRFQIFQSDVMLIVDVAHNPHAAKSLVENLRALPCSGKTIAVFSMLGDKDIAGVAACMKDVVDAWVVAELREKRAASLEVLLAALRQAGVEQESVTPAVGVAEGFAQACRMAGENDRILAFGSFHTVADVLAENRA